MSLFRQFADELFEHFVGLALKGLKEWNLEPKTWLRQRTYWGKKAFQAVSISFSFFTQMTSCIVMGLSLVKEG